MGKKNKIRMSTRISDASVCRQNAYSLQIHRHFFALKSDFDCIWRHYTTLNVQVAGARAQW